MRRLAAFVFVSFLSVSVYAQDCKYYDFVRGVKTDPYEYIVGKLKQYNVVSLGEDHWIDAHLEFLGTFLDRMSSDSTVHIDALAWESGNQVDQKLADTLMRAKTFREDLAVRILQNSADTYGFPYKEAVDALKALWRYNLVQKNFTRLLLLDPSGFLTYLDSGFYDSNMLSRDEAMAERIKEYIYFNKKVLFYAGSGHTMRQIWSQYIGKSGMYANMQSAGFILHSLYPENVFSIRLWGGYMGSNGYVPSEGKFRWKCQLGGIVDEAFLKNRNRPIGFDIAGNVFGEIRRKDFFDIKFTDAMLNKKNGSPFREDETLADMFDGIVFFKPVNEFTPAHIYAPVFDDAFVDKVSRRTGGKVKTKAEIINMIKAEHPGVE